MNHFAFIQYFFYLGINWNWWIALHLLVHEIKGEKKYGLHTTGADELEKARAAGVDTSHATLYMPASYPLLEAVFNELPASSRHHFLDIGCGKGRAMCVAAHHGYHQVTGIDFSTEFCLKAEENLLRTRQQFPSLTFEVLVQEASRYRVPEDVNCIFFFNPFDRHIMHLVTNNILDSYRASPRVIHVIYLNPLYKTEFTDIGFKEVFYTKRLKYMEAVILQLAP